MRSRKIKTEIGSIEKLFSALKPNSEELLLLRLATIMPGAADGGGLSVAMQRSIDSKPSYASPLKKSDLVLITNRLAMWRFFERYVIPAAMEGPNGKKMRNPFKASEDLLRPALRGWKPIMAAETRRYCERTENGWELYEDMLALAQVAFLEALERQAMDIISMSKKAQLIPFHLKLRYAIQRHMHQNIPDLIGGGIRVGLDSKQASNDRPQLVSFDEYIKQTESEDEDT